MMKAKVTHTVVRRSLELPLDYNAMSLKVEQNIPVEWQPGFYEKEGGHERRCEVLTTWGSEASPRTRDKPPLPQGPVKEPAS